MIWLMCLLVIVIVNQQALIWIQQRLIRAQREGLRLDRLLLEVDGIDRWRTRQGRMAGLDAWLDYLDAEHGPPSAETIAEADAWGKRTYRRKDGDRNNG